MTTANKIVAIYARYSSDLQNERSIEDQIESCRRVIHGDEMVTKIYSDKAISGAHISNRPGIIKLLKDIETGSVGVIIAEDLDRISRSQSEIAKIFNLAEYHGTEIRTIFSGKVSDIHIGLMGTMSALELKKIAERTKRGQHGSVRVGKAPGGLAYGYAVEPYNNKGELEKGWRHIIPEQAVIVRRIYAEYLTGKLPGKIARTLNEEGVPSPKGGKWSTTTITGHWGRFNGILQNPLYSGKLLWNRNNFSKHPLTGKRVMRPNKKEVWVEYDAPHLQIVDTDVWNAVQQRRVTKRLRISKTGQPYPSFDFNLFCGVCGDKMVMVSSTYLRCFNSKRFGTCTQVQKIRRDEMMSRLFNYIGQFTDLKYWSEWQAFIDKTLKDSSAKISTIEHEIGDVWKKNKFLLDAITTGLGVTCAVIERMTMLDQTSRKLHDTLTTLRDLPRHEEISREGLENALKKAETNDARLLLVNSVISSIKVARDEDGSIIFTDVTPDLHGMAQINSK